MVPMSPAAAQVAPLDPTHLPQVRDLINAHLGLLVPGWALTETFIASHLQRNPGEAITDPWVRGRTTLCALQGPRLVAAAHLLRYGSGPEVGPAYAGTGEIAWFLAWADAPAAAASLLATARDQMQAWSVSQEDVWNTGLPVGPFVGVPDVWPHIAAALAAAGFRPGVGNEEEVYGGSLEAVPPPATSPVPGLALERRLTAGLWANREICLAALVDGQEIGRCEIALDLRRPAPSHGFPVDDDLNACDCAESIDGLFERLRRNVEGERLVQIGREG